MGSFGLTGSSTCTTGAGGLAGAGGAGATGAGAGGVGLRSVVVHPVSHKAIMQVTDPQKTGFRR
jgi:hypothetical protein